jgi:thioredoxin-related protein
MKKLIIIFLFLISCSNKDETKQVDESSIKYIDLKNVLIPIDKKLQVNNSDYILLHYFDGGCAFCIGEFIGWLKQWQELDINENIKCLYISIDTDELLFNHYLENSGITINNWSLVIIDKENVFQKDNPNIYPNSGFYLLDSNKNIITSENPIMSKKALAIYKSLKIVN